MRYVRKRSYFSLLLACRTVRRIRRKFLWVPSLLFLLSIPWPSFSLLYVAMFDRCACACDRQSITGAHRAPDLPLAAAVALWPSSGCRSRSRSWMCQYHRSWRKSWRLLLVRSFATFVQASGDSTGGRAQILSRSWMFRCHGSWSRIVEVIKVILQKRQRKRFFFFLRACGEGARGQHIPHVQCPTVPSHASHCKIQWLSGMLWSRPVQMHELQHWVRRAHNPRLSVSCRGSRCFCDLFQLFANAFAQLNIRSFRVLRTSAHAVAARLRLRSSLRALSSTVTLAANERRTQIVFVEKTDRVRPNLDHSCPRQLVTYSPTHWITQDALLVTLS